MRISDWSSDVCSPDLRYLEEHDAFDAEAGVNHERTIVKDEAGTDAEVDLWTTCFTPREVRLLAAGSGLDVSAVWSVPPGRSEVRRVGKECVSTCSYRCAPCI